MPPGELASRNHKPREWRRRVVLRARLRTAAGWSDACILNVSSRGMLIHTSRPTAAGSTVELWHGEHVIPARIVWKKGPHAGLRAEDMVPVDQIMILSKTPALQLTADGQRVERRRRRRDHDHSRLISRALEFAGIVVIAVSLSGAAFAMMRQAIAGPMAQIRAALDAGRGD